MALPRSELGASRPRALGADDGLGRGVRAELGVQLADVGPDGMAETYSSLAICAVGRLVGR
jgi:hypothetical protein